MTKTKNSIPAMSSPGQLKRWLQASDRRWLIMSSVDLVDALPWPDGVQTLIGIIDAYARQRNLQAAVTVECPRMRVHGDAVCDYCRNTGTVVSRVKTDVLETDEEKAVVNALLARIRARDPSWTPEGL